jgi:hypothetical protein
MGCCAARPWTSSARSDNWERERCRERKSLGNCDKYVDLATSTTTSSKTSVSFVSSSLTTGISLLSLSDKSAVDVVGDLDVDCATESFCSSCAIPPRVVGMVVGGLWSDGVGCDLCCYDCGSGEWGCLRELSWFFYFFYFHFYGVLGGIARVGFPTERVLSRTPLILYFIRRHRLLCYDPRL